jgi:hypothetical protein
MRPKCSCEYNDLKRDFFPIMIGKWLQRLGLAWTGFALAVSILDAKTGLDGEEEEVAHTLRHSTASRPNIVVTDIDPRLDLVKRGFALEEVAKMNHGTARTRIRNVELILRAAEELGYGVQENGTLSATTSSSSSFQSTPINNTFYELSKTLPVEEVQKILEVTAPVAIRATLELELEEIRDIRETIEQSTGGTTGDSPDFRPPDATLDIFADAAQLVNHLLTDVVVGNGTPNQNRVFNRGRLMANSFNYTVVEQIAKVAGHEEIAQSILTHLKGERLTEGSQFQANLADVFTNDLNSDLLMTRRFEDVGDLFGLTTDDLSIFTGEDIIFLPDSVVDVSKWMGSDASQSDKARIFAFGAADDVFINGDVHITNHGHEPMDQALAIGGGDHLVIEDADISYDGSNLGLGAGQAVIILKSSISTRDHLAIGSLGDMILEDVSLSAGKGNRTFLYAHNTLDAKGLEFSDGLRQVYMEATTVNLRNVDFPAGSEVRLVSQLGGIDGKYPNFGAAQPGRVNFLDKVSYGGEANLMTDRTSFDRFGQNISIEPFNQ